MRLIAPVRTSPPRIGGLHKLLEFLFEVQTDRFVGVKLVHQALICDDPAWDAEDTPHWAKGPHDDGRLEGVTSRQTLDLRTSTLYLHGCSNSEGRLDRMYPVLPRDLKMSFDNIIKGRWSSSFGEIEVRHDDKSLLVLCQYVPARHRDIERNYITTAKYVDNTSTAYAYLTR